MHLRDLTPPALAKPSDGLLVFAIVSVLVPSPPRCEGLGISQCAPVGIVTKPHQVGEKRIPGQARRLVWVQLRFRVSHYRLYGKTPEERGEQMYLHPPVHLPPGRPWITPRHEPPAGDMDCGTP